MAKELAGYRTARTEARKVLGKRDLLTLYDIWDSLTAVSCYPDYVTRYKLDTLTVKDCAVLDYYRLFSAWR